MFKALMSAHVPGWRQFERKGSLPSNESRATRSKPLSRRLQDREV